jgi:hypothetical protein
MAGIKFHGAIDGQIIRNHIYRTVRGLWLDWMAQGTRVSRNLFHENRSEDLFVEVDHGPFLVDNNIFLSPVSLLDMSEGGAYAHNLMTGQIISRPEPSRVTPYHPAHSTAVAGLVDIKGGDDRFYNNILVAKGEASSGAGKQPDRSAGFGLWVYDSRPYPLFTGGNIYCNGARPYSKEANDVRLPGLNPKVRIVEEGQSAYLHLTWDPAMHSPNATLVTTELLGIAKVPGLAYENPDGSPLKVDTDYFGKRRNKVNPTPGPFEKPDQGDLKLKVW